MGRKKDDRLVEIRRLYEQCDERGRNDILMCAEAAVDMTKKFAGPDDQQDGEE